VFYPALFICAPGRAHINYNLESTYVIYRRKDGGLWFMFVTANPHLLSNPKDRDTRTIFQNESDF
jgi:hypothetical protein